jgi:hypothetical protein
MAIAYIASGAYLSEFCPHNFVTSLNAEQWANLPERPILDAPSVYVQSYDETSGNKGRTGGGSLLEYI